jgi:hypothetical protein
MALDAPFYLAIGDCIVEPGDGSAAYHVTSMSFPEPAPDGAGGHFSAVRVVGLRVEATTAAALSTAVAVLRREAVRDNTLAFKPTLAGDTLTCRIREASVVEADFNPLRRSVAPFVARLTLTVETDPYWLGSWSADITPTVTGAPGHFDTAATITGEVDALVRMRVVNNAAGKFMAVGIRPNPATGYDYVDDYSGVADPNAFGGGKVASSALTATLAAVGTAPNIDTTANRGRHLVLARLDNNATSQSTVTYRAVQRTTGHLIAVSTDVAEQAVTSPSASLVGVELGDVMIPSGQVPDVTTGSGYAAAAITDQQTTENADTSGEMIYIVQSVSLTAGEKVTGFTFKTGSNVSAAYDLVSVSIHPDIVDQVLSPSLAAASVVNAHAANTEYTASFDYVVPATARYAFLVSMPGDNTLRYNTAGGYAGGTLWTSVSRESGYSDTGDDLYFKVFCAAPLGFNSNTIIQAADSAAASKVANLDYVQRVPVDFGAIVYRLGSYSVAPALFYDGDTDTPYVADADGIGPSVYDKCEIRRPLRYRPGVVNRVVFGLGVGSSAPSAPTVVYAWRPRYLTATG